MTTPSPAPVDLPVANIRPNPRNPRKLGLDTSSIGEMVRSIQAEGLLEPVLVRLVEATPIAGAFYELIAGERRWRAFQMMKASHIPARVLDADEAAAAAKCLVGFLQSKSATPMEEAIGYQRAMDLKDAAGAAVFTVAELSRRTGRPEAIIHERLLLVELPDAAQKALLSGRLDVGHLVPIARLPEPASREAALQRVLGGDDAGRPYTVEAVQALIKGEFMRDLRAAPFNRKDPALLPAAGACDTCPHRSGANPARFGVCTGGAAQMCNRPSCYRDKVLASRMELAEDLKAEGVAVLSPEECEREFPAGHKGLRFDSVYVVLDAPVPSDLLKAEVAAHGKVTWTELLDDAKAKPKIKAGFDQQGMQVRLVERDLAIAAVDADSGDDCIFRKSEGKKSRITRESVAPAEQEAEDSGQKTAKPVAPAPVAASNYDFAEADKLINEIDDYLTRRGWQLAPGARTHPENFIQPKKPAKKAA